MTGSSGIFSVPSEHVPGLIALAILPVALWLALCAVKALALGRVSWAEYLVGTLRRLSFATRAALVGLVVGAVVHAVLVPTHWQDAHVTALLFVVDTLGFIFAFVWTLGQWRFWELLDAAMLVGTAAVYGLYLLVGWETADPVGLVTTTIELASGLLLLASAISTGSERRPNTDRWLGVAAVPIALASLLGVSAIGGQLTDASPNPSAFSTARPTRAPTLSAGPGSGSSMAGMGGTSASTTSTLHLATTSPAGDVVWPVDMTTMAPGMEMATPNCHAKPTPAQQEAATQLVDQTVADVAPYKSLEVAKAAGYEPITPSGQKIVHYINPSFYRQGEVLDPAKIPVLVYVNTAHGAVLSAAMYLMPPGSGIPPQPGGCLTQWHIHSNLCFSADSVVGKEAGGACAGGSVNRTTSPMMHVWMAPVAGGPLVPDPSPVSQVEAAVQMEPSSPVNGTA